MRPSFKIRSGKHLLSLGQRTQVMGIVNLTPDSFSHDGWLAQKKNSTERIFKHIQKMVHDGADIIDIGGESSRPGSKPITVKEEIKRVVPVIQFISKHLTVPISIDTYKPEVAQEAIQAGATIVNNILGTESNIELLKTVQKHKTALVLMHIKGRPRTMQKDVHYKNLIKEIKLSLTNSMEKCLDIGISLDKIILDPGIGFGKTTAHNLEIIKQLKEFESLNRPILVGVSRKSFIGNILKTDVENRLTGSIAAGCACVFNGAHILRVHDVKETRKAVDVVDAILSSK